MGERMRSKLKFCIIFIILLFFVQFWFSHCQDSYLLAKGRLISISSAIRNYQMDNDEFPYFDKLEEHLLRDYLAFIPEDPITKSNKFVKFYDGTGGWVYDTDNYILQINSIQWWNPYTWSPRLTIRFDNILKNSKKN